VEAVMRESDDLVSPQRVDSETWTDLLRSVAGRHSLHGIEPNTFAGWVRPLSVSGLMALDICCSSGRVERSRRDVCLDGLDRYKALIQIAGQSRLYQNDQAVQLGVGDVVLIDSARPMTCVFEGSSTRWLALYLPRRSLIDNIGFEPPAGACSRGELPAGRLLYEVALNALKGSAAESSPGDSYMRLVVYDLLGALFAPSDPSPLPSRRANNLFMRVRGVVKNRFADADFGPAEAATELGISLRYLQKLFNQRGTTCTEYIYSLRLNHAARLLDCRALLRASEPLSAIAYACGFNDYTHFARKFRQRFGYSPGARSGAPGRARSGAMRSGADESASRTHEV
jgi:AraC family transcriptional regulator, positive regulator of tynA and feaB